MSLCKVDCGSCRACCKHEIIFLHPESGDDPRRYMTRTAINPLTGQQQLALMQKPNGDCLYLGESGCTIYGQHPAICQKFDCVRFARKMDAAMRDMPRAMQKERRKMLRGTPYEVGKMKDTGQ